MKILNFNNNDILIRNFTILIILIIIFPIPLVYWAGTRALSISIFMSFIIGIIYISIESIHLENIWPNTNIQNHVRTRLQLILSTLLLLSVLVMFDATNIGLRAKFNIISEDNQLWDEAFMKFDTLILGLFFPRGQLSLFLDTNNIIGTNSFIAPFYTEYLQLAYVSYYVWGNVLGIHLMYVHYTNWMLNKKKVLGTSWRRLQMFLCAWLGAFVLNFTMNQMFPAVSPRIYLKDEYESDIRGLFLANIIRDKLKSAAKNSYTVFPSGHCGLSWTAYFVAKRLGYIKYSKYAFYGAISITLATLVLRYHYFADAFFSPILVTFGLYLSGMLTQAQADNLQRMYIENDDNNIDEQEIKQDV